MTDAGAMKQVGPPIQRMTPKPFTGSAQPSAETRAIVKQPVSPHGTKGSRSSGGGAADSHLTSSHDSITKGMVGR